MKVVANMESEEEKEIRKQERDEKEKQESLMRISTASIDATKQEMNNTTKSDPVSILKVDEDKKEEGEIEEDNDQPKSSGGGLKKISLKL